MTFNMISSIRAYLDPGSGSLLVQLALGVILGVGVFFRIFWKKIKGFFIKGKKDSNLPSDPTDISEFSGEGLGEVHAGETDKKTE